jgi:MFS family permease
MNQTSEPPAHPSAGPLAPLRVASFRRIWSASLVSNSGHLILGVAAAWEMTRLTDSPQMIALVQTALMVPLMLVALPAGALADMFDRRKIALVGLCVASLMGAGLTVISFADLTTPWLLLGFLVLIGGGVALYGPAWQASIGELVPLSQLPSAVALGSVSYNLARSVGPAVGGLIVTLLGTRYAFGASACGYLVLAAAFLLWRRQTVPARLPPESFGRALVSGFRYARHANGVRNVVIRAFAFGLSGATAIALAPLIARDLLSGGPTTYGVLLGASGVGAVGGSLMTSWVRDRLGPEWAVRLLIVASGAALSGIAFSRTLPVTCACFVVIGAGNMTVVSMLNVGVQLSSPRWVTARALSLFTSALTGGVAIGSWAYGAAVTGFGLELVIAVSGGSLAATALLGFILPLRRESEADRQPAELSSEPDVALAVTMRSGPIAISIDYRVDPEHARDFYLAMQAVRTSRMRNGAFGWAITRDIADPWMWTERYDCPTWGDYLRLRDRFTAADREAQTRADAYNTLDGARRVRRGLERPFGSVRWQADTPDPRQPETGVYTP